MVRLRRKELKPFKLTYGVTRLDHRAGSNSFIIQEGYSVAKIRQHYKYMITVLASGEKIFPAFLSLSSFIDPSFMAILEDNADPDVPVIYIASACTIDEALDTFREHEFQLVNDGLSSFGLASRQFEVFVESHKEIHVFSNTTEGILKAIEKMGIPKARKLEHLGKEHHVHLSLRAYLYDEQLPVHSEPLPEKEYAKYKKNPEEYENFFQNIVERLGMVKNSNVMQSVR
jgi:hypothetical protein